MNEKLLTSPASIFGRASRSRRSHQKSRNGCLTCKRRKKKCDEKRPSCLLCEEGLRTCTYATNDSPTGSTKFLTTSRFLVSSPSSLRSMSCESLSNQSSKICPRHSTPTRTSSQVGTDVAVTNFTDADLYLHFLNHTCKYAPCWQENRIVLQVGMAKLALDGEPVSHSVLALSAACLCCDNISNGNADPEIVRQILDLGLQHHTLALEQMRTLTNCPKESEVQSLLVNALMLVPFAFAFQHINHWVLRAKGSQDTDPLTPRDAILLLRGIKTTIVVLNSNRADKSVESKTSYDTNVLAKTTDARDYAIMPERSHIMFPVLAASYHKALSQLQCRILSAVTKSRGAEDTASVLNAYNTLKHLMSSTFSNSKENEHLWECATHVSVAPNSLLAQVPSWLRNFVLQQPRPTHTEPLARSFLAFFSGASKTYVDLLLPLLEPRTDNVENSPELTTAEVLAVDVYAHWLVLMILVENEAWWVGDFPLLALKGLTVRYKKEFPGSSSITELWWPASMLDVVTCLNQWK